MNAGSEYTTEELNEFQDFIKFMRESINWTRKKFAEALGVSETTIYKWETEGSFYRQDLYELETSIRSVVKEEIKKRRLIKS